MNMNYFIFLILLLNGLSSMAADEKKCALIKSEIKSAHEFQLNLPAGEKGKTVEDLQDEYDKALAEVVILEGLEKLTKNYEEFNNKILDKDFGIAPKYIAKNYETVTKGHQAIRRLAAIKNYLEELIGEPKDNHIAVEQKGDYYEMIKSRCQSSGKKNSLCQAILENESSLFHNIPFLPKGVEHKEFKDMINGFNRAMYIHTSGEDQEEAKKKVQKLLDLVSPEHDSSKKLSGDDLQKNLNLVNSLDTQFRENIADLLDLKKQERLTKEEIPGISNTTAIETEKKKLIKQCFTSALGKENKECAESFKKVHTNMIPHLKAAKALLGKSAAEKIVNQALITDKFKEKKEDIMAIKKEIENFANNRPFATDKIEELCPNSFENMSFKLDELTSCLGRNKSSELKVLKEEAQEKLKEVNKKRNYYLMPSYKKKGHPSYTDIDTMKQYLYGQANKHCEKKLTISSLNQSCRPKIEALKNLDNFIRDGKDLLASLDKRFATDDVDNYWALKSIAYSCKDEITKIDDQPLLQSSCLRIRERFGRLKKNKEEKDELDDFEKGLSDHTYHYDPATGGMVKKKKPSYFSYISPGLKNSLPSLAQTYFGLEGEKQRTNLLTGQAIWNKNFYHQSQQAHQWYFGGPSPLSPYGLGTFQWNNPIFYGTSPITGTDTGISNPVGFSFN